MIAIENLCKSEFLVYFSKADVSSCITDGAVFTKWMRFFVDYFVFSYSFHVLL